MLHQPAPPGCPPTRLVARLRQAAQMRVAGATWEAIAATVGRARSTVSEWPSNFPVAWRRALVVANQDYVHEVVAEAVLTLRRHLRSDDDKVSRDAATKLITFALAAGKGPKPRAAGAKAAKSNGAAGYLEGMTDDQLDALLAELLPSRPTQHDSDTRRLDADAPAGPT